MLKILPKETDKIQSYLKNQPPSNETSEVKKHLIRNGLHMLIEEDNIGLIIQGNSKSEEFISEFIEQASLDDRLPFYIIVKDPEASLPPINKFYIINVDAYLSLYAKDKTNLN